MKWTIPDNIEYKGKWVSNWFSNMLPFDFPVTYQEILYNTPENMYQAMKMPKDRLDLREKLAAMSPHTCKTSIRNKNLYPWDVSWTKEKSLEVMEWILRKKFTKDSTWGRKLIDVEKDIVEWNNWNDLFWGASVKTGEGENHLGIILMKIREDLKIL